MKRFSFPLEQVRKWRHDQAELEEMRLQQFYGELRKVQDARREAQREMEDAEESVYGRQTPEVLDLAHLENFRQFTRERIGWIDEQKREWETKIGEQRQKVIEARRQYELLDKLKAKSLSDWKAGRDKEEEELAAELYLAKRRRDLN